MRIKYVGNNLFTIWCNADEIWQMPPNATTVMFGGGGYSMYDCNEMDVIFFGRVVEHG